MKGEKTLQLMRGLKTNFEECFKAPRQKLHEESQEENCTVMQSSSHTGSPLLAMQIGCLVCEYVCACVSVSMCDFVCTVVQKS